MSPSERQRHQVEITGTVQGVGFRPFVHRLAAELALGGWARNNGEGLSVEIEGPREACDAFLRRLPDEAPGHAVLRSLKTTPRAPAGETAFRIRASSVSSTATAEPAPDLATCPDCLRELFDPADRRYRHPFINCTQCGPRYSILLSLPCDRERTTMRRFTMCPACREEYESPENRRFHAQPIACPECGPRLAFADEAGRPLAEGEEALESAARTLESGRIVAVKGIGGFHLLVDARSPEAVKRLRRRKHRPAKPLATMMPDLAAVRRHCELPPMEEGLLASAQAPIVLLRRCEGDTLPEALAPGNPTLGVLLPYSPTHHLLLRRLGFPVVATSGNLSDEPLCRDESEAYLRLRGVADAFLVHDRPIARAADDSVLRLVLGGPLMLRRARGYAPTTLEVGTPLPPLLATGGDQKTALALTGPFGIRCAPHLGDLGSEAAQDAFLAQARDFPALCGVAPAAVACDLHPDYHSVRLAEGLGLPLVRVPHHHAHIAACLAEHGVDGEVLGVAWDGTGYGPDGTLWGGEFLLASQDRCERFASLRPFPLPGGERAIREPRYAALGLLHAAGIAVEDTPLAGAFSSEELDVARLQLGRGLHAPPTASAGRLFDAVAALLGLRLRNEFEAQAAMELEFAAGRVAEAAADPDHHGMFPGFALQKAPLGSLDWEPVLRGLLAGLAAKVPVPVLAARFHDALRDGILLVAQAAGKETVVLTGGCFQNARLLESSVAALSGAGFTPLWPRLFPPNDGGLALGQALVAARRSLSPDARPDSGDRRDPN